MFNLSPFLLTQIFGNQSATFFSVHNKQYGWGTPASLRQEVAGLVQKSLISGFPVRVLLFRLSRMTLIFYPVQAIIETLRSGQRRLTGLNHFKTLEANYLTLQWKILQKGLNIFRVLPPYAMPLPASICRSIRGGVGKRGWPDPKEKGMKKIDNQVNICLISYINSYFRLHKRNAM